jgi:gliding motility-associated-like protein
MGKYWSFLFLLIVYFVEGYGQVHELQYVENRGQWESNILFKSSIKEGNIYLERDRITIDLFEKNRHHPRPIPSDSLPKRHAYNILFQGCNQNAKIQRNEKDIQYFNYFLGSDSSKWRGGCHAFREITYQEIYPNIDLKIQSEALSLKYSFILKKGARIEDIKMRYNGLDSLWIDREGNLQCQTTMGNSVDLKPISYEWMGDYKKTIETHFDVNKNLVTFRIPSISSPVDRNIELDPSIVFSSYTGSTADNFGATATFDYLGNVYAAGMVYDQGYPITVGAFDNTFNNVTNKGYISDIGITKFSSNGSTIIYSTYIGGNSNDCPHSLVVDQNNRLILLATTSSNNYPVTAGAYDNTFNGGSAVSGSLFAGLGLEYPNGADIVITKFNALGSALIGSTFFGGSGTDGVGNDIALNVNYGDVVRGEVMTDSNDFIYIASTTTSTNLPTTQFSYKSTNSGGQDGFIAKFNVNLTSLVRCTYFGGSGNDAFYDLCFDTSGNIIVAGGTTSSNLPTTSGVVSPTAKGSTDGMIASFDPSMSVLRFATYYGTSSYDQIYFIESNRKNEIYVYGQTTDNTNYYTQGALYSLKNTGQFISKFNVSLTARTQSMYFGARDNNPDLSPTAFLVDYCDKIFVSGWGSDLGTGASVYSLKTTGLPVTANAVQPTTVGGQGFYFMILEGDMSALNYGTYFGGTTSSSDEHVDGGTSRFDKNGIIYQAICAGCGGAQSLTIYPNPSSVAGPLNKSPNCNLAVVKFDFGLPVKADFTSSTDCAPGNITLTNNSHKVGTSLTYFWDFGNGQTSTLANPTTFYATPGTYNVKLKVSDPASCNLVDSIVKPVLMLGYKSTKLPDKKVCAGGSSRIGFPNVTDPSITISWTPTSYLDDPNILAPYASPTTTTTYRAIMIKGSCIDTGFQTVVVGGPSPMSISGLDQVCTNSNSKYTGTSYALGTYKWEPSASVLSSNRDTASMLISSSPFTIKLTYINEYGCETITTKNVTSGPASVSVVGDTIACKNELLNYTFTPVPPGGTFTFSPMSNVVSQNNNVVTFLVDTARWLVFDYNFSANCRKKDSIYIRLLKDVLKINADTLICKNSNAIVNATTNPRYSLFWTPSADLVSSQGSSPAVFNLKGVEKYLVVQATNVDRPSCFVKDSLKIKFIDNLFKMTADQTRCKDSGVTIYYASVPNVTYTWSPASLLVSSTSTYSKFKTDVSRYYYVTVTDNSGCQMTDSIFVSVIDDLVQIWGNNLICPNDTVSLHVTKMTGATYSWKPLSKIISGASSSDCVAGNLTSSWISVHISDTNKCEINDSILVNTLDLSSFKILDHDSTYCKGDTIRIHAAYNPLLSYTWTPSSFILPPKDSSVVAALVSKNTTFVVLARHNTRNCSVTDSVKISIDTNYLKLTASPVVCFKDTFLVKANFSPNYTYNWSTTNLVNSNKNVAYFRCLSDIYYSCSIKTAPFGCLYKDSIFVERSKELDDLSAKATPSTINYGDTSQLSANSKGGIYYLWTPDSSLDNQYIKTPVAFPKHDMTYVVSVQDKYHCKSSDSVSIKVVYEVCGDPEVFVPNAFTPNHDDMNDRLFVRGDNITRVYFAVYDRWGQMVFETRDQKISWDGTYKGEVLAPSVFAYYLEVDCIGGAHFSKKGNVTLIR